MTYQLCHTTGYSRVTDIPVPSYVLHFTSVREICPAVAIKWPFFLTHSCAKLLVIFGYLHRRVK